MLCCLAIGAAVVAAGGLASATKRPGRKDEGAIEAQPVVAEPAPAATQETVGSISNLSG